MNEEGKKVFTETLKNLELRATQLKNKLEFLNKQIEISFQYQDELAGRMSVAKKENEGFRNEFFKTSTELNDVISKMKGELCIYTGNFYSI